MDHMEYSQFFYDGKTVKFEDALQPDKSDLKSDYNKDRLYCPECQTARLRFTSRTSKHRAYLSTWQGDHHPQDCSHAYEPASKQQIKEYYKTLTPAQINDKLEAAINSIVRRDQRNTDDNIRNTPDNNPAIATMRGKDGTQIYHRLPVRSINTMGTATKEDYDIPILFSGKVLLQVKERPSNYEGSTPYYFLNFYNKTNHKWINRTYRSGYRDNINENHVYLVSLIAILREIKNKSYPKVELYSQNSIQYRLYKTN